MSAAWLSDSRNPRTVLVEANARAANGELITHRFSSRAFQSKPSDGQAWPYACVLEGDIQIAASADAALEIGALTLRNNGELDDALHADFGGQAITLALGDASWARAQFMQVSLRADDEGLRGSGDKLSLSLRDPLAALDSPVCKSTTANEKIVPWGAGMCFNLAPVFIAQGVDGALFQVNEDAIAAINVRSGGLAIDPAALSLNLGMGKFLINPPPSGEVTADVTFGHDGNGVIDIIKNLLARTDLSLDQANFAYWQTQCPQLGGVYVDSTQSYREVLDFVCDSVGLRLGIFPSNQVYLWRIGAPAAGAQVINIGNGEIVDKSLAFVRKITPYAMARLGYQKNWHPLEASSLFGTGEDLNFIDLMNKPWRAVTVTDTAIDADYPAAIRMPDGDITETALLLQADASFEANRRLTVFAKSVYEFRLSFHGDFIYRLGSAILVSAPRYGFDDGVLGQVVSVNWRPLAGISELTFWVWR